jgi:hypothetical protein
LLNFINEKQNQTLKSISQLNETFSTYNDAIEEIQRRNSFKRSLQNRIDAMNRSLHDLFSEECRRRSEFLRSHHYLSILSMFPSLNPRLASIHLSIDHVDSDLPPIEYSKDDDDDGGGDDGGEVGEVGDDGGGEVGDGDDDVHDDGGDDNGGEVGDGDGGIGEGFDKSGSGNQIEELRNENDKLKLEIEKMKSELENFRISNQHQTNAILQNIFNVLRECEHLGDLDGGDDHQPDSNINDGAKNLQPSDKKNDDCDNNNINNNNNNDDIDGGDNFKHFENKIISTIRTLYDRSKISFNNINNHNDPPLNIENLNINNPCNNNDDDNNALVPSEKHELNQYRKEVMDLAELVYKSDNIEPSGSVVGTAIILLSRYEEGKRIVFDHFQPNDYVLVERTSNGYLKIVSQNTSHYYLDQK